MNKYSVRKIAALVAFGLAIVAIASLVFVGNASAASPDVETRSASDISDDSARLNGYLYTNGEDTTYWFEYGTSRTNLNHDTSEREVSDRDGRVTVYNTISNGLDSDETYYFRLVAENDDGIERGAVLSFATDGNGGSNSNDLPEVDTLSADIQSNNSVTLNGRVDANGDYAQVWFRYGQNRNSLSSVTPTLNMLSASDDSFSRVIRNLNSGATYYYQAVARNSEGTDYGQVLSFVASSNGGNGGNNGNASAPSVSTNSATVTGNTSALLRAQVNPNGNLSSVWFEYGRTTALGGVTTRDPAGSGNSNTEYSVNVYGLSAGTTYYYRAVAQSTSGTNRGQMMTFRTSGSQVVNPPVNPPVNPGNDDDGGSTPSTPTPVVTGAPGCFTVSPALTSTQLKAGQDFTYSVTYRNDCGYALSAGSLEVTMPVATEFAGTNYPFLSRDGNVITYNLGVIAPNFQSAVTVDGKVRSQVNNGDSLIFQANVAFTNPNGARQDASGYLSAMIVGAEADIANGTSTLGASAADALSGLFHSGWFWLVLFLILIALFVFWLATRRRDGEEDDEEEDAHAGH
jgi:hypothetical protein